MSAAGKCGGIVALRKYVVVLYCGAGVCGTFDDDVWWRPSVRDAARGWGHR